MSWTEYEFCAAESVQHSGGHDAPPPAPCDAAILCCLLLILGTCISTGAKEAGTCGDEIAQNTASEHSTAIDFTISCPLLPSYAAAAALDAHAIITARAAEKTAKHAPGSAARGRLFLPWVITTFGGIGPATIWHFIDSIYATSSSLAILNLTSAHAVATRKAHFLASFHASLIRSSYAMLTLHTAEPTTARPAHNPAHNPAQQRNDIPSPAPSIPTSDDDDDTPRRTTTTTPGRT